MARCAAAGAAITMHAAARSLEDVRFRMPGKLRAGARIVHAPAAGDYFAAAAPFVSRNRNTAVRFVFTGSMRRSAVSLSV